MLRKNNKRMPDVLDCLANLSNDEVFTPPEIANRMLDLLPQELFESKETTFLDPFTKSGVFLREITKRLLSHQIPNYEEMSGEIDEIEKTAIQKAVKSGNLDLQDANYGEMAQKIGREAIDNHCKSVEFHNFEKNLQKELNRILTTQVFGIAITELTAQLARRSLYCSKNAFGKYSICSDFENEYGNIRFKPCQHAWDKKPKWIELDKKWVGATCVFCGASSETFDRPNELEQHAYEFIHTAKVEEIFNMKFDVICGNPPYQLKVNETGKGLGAVPIYHKFIEQAKRLDPKYLTMIIPARWFSGGVGLDKFRKTMLEDTKIKYLVDYTNSQECFPGVDINGGVCYFLIDKQYNGLCNYTNVVNGNATEFKRNLNEFDIFVRRNEAVSIIHKVQAMNEKTLAESGGCSPQTPYGILSTFVGNEEKQNDDDCRLLSSKGWSWVEKSKITKSIDTIDLYKPMMSKLSCEHAGNPDKNGMFRVISRTEILNPNEVCSQSYLTICPQKTKENAENVMTYLKTKFVRFLILQTLSGMNLSTNNFKFVPWLDFNQKYTDDFLYKKYKLTQDEIDFIESIIRPMDNLTQTNKTDLLSHINDTYEEFVNVLLKKYGKVKGDYFVNKQCKSKNQKIIKTNEGLNIHHIDEDKVILLGEPKIAAIMPFEYQKADRLVYANLLEHLLLHIKISQEAENNDIETIGKVGTGGVIMIIRQINDYFGKLPIEPTGWRLQMFNAIRENYNDYIELLKYILNSDTESLCYTTTELSSGWNGEVYNDILSRLEE